MEPNRTLRRADDVSPARRTGEPMATMADISEHVELFGRPGDPSAWCAGLPGTGRPADVDGPVTAAIGALTAQLL